VSVKAGHSQFDSHPDDAEPGHAKHCGCRVRALARLRAAWDDGTDDPCDDQCDERAGDDQDGATGGVSGRW
jgi:hypothetical protein